MNTTAKQAKLLRQLNLPIPSDLDAASRLINFALEGNNDDQDAKHRRASIRAYWNRWVGKLVKIIQVGHFFQGACGKVEYLQARTKEEARQIIASHSARKTLPFIAIVRLEPASPRILVKAHLTGLKRVQVIQKRLFPP